MVIRRQFSFHVCFIIQMDLLNVSLSEINFWEQLDDNFTVCSYMNKKLNLPSPQVGTKTWIQELEGKGPTVPVYLSRRRMRMIKKALALGMRVAAK